MQTGNAYQSLTQGPQKFIKNSLMKLNDLIINELLNIKVSQLRTLTKESWIGIDRSKDGPCNDKLSFIKEAKKIVQDRKKIVFNERP